MHRSWPIVLPLVLLVVVACASRGTPKEIATPLDPAELAALYERAAVLRAEDRRAVDEGLRQALSSASEVNRAAAILAMGRIRDVSSRGAISAAMADPAPRVRAAAVFAQALLDDGGPHSGLVAALQDPVPTVRAAAAAAAGVTRPVEAIGALSALLVDPEPSVREAACYALARFDHGDQDIAQLATLMGTEPHEVALAAAHAMARMAAPPGRLVAATRQRVRESLRDLTRSYSPEMRAVAAQGLALPGSPNETALLGQLLADRDARVRIAAVRSLGHAGASVQPHFASALEDDDERVVLAAVETLGKLRGTDAIDRLVEFIAQDPRAWLRQRAVEALGQIDVRRAATLARSMARDENPLIRAEAARLLRRQPERASIDLALELTADPTPRVRSAALPAAVAGTEPLRQVLAQALQDPDLLVRAAAVEAAEDRLVVSSRSHEERQEALAVLRDLWQGAAQDSIPLIELNVIQAAARPRIPEEARELLLLGLSSKHHAVRRRAAQGLLDRFGEDHRARVGVVVDHPLEHYAQILRWGQKPRAAEFVVARPGFEPGWFTVRLATESSPLATWNFSELAEQGFFDGTFVYRLVPGFLVQSGDPLNTGVGGPAYEIRDELQLGRFPIGTLGVATTARDSGGSQWFITLGDQPQLEGRFTPMGQVVRNFPGVVWQLLPYDRVVSVRVSEGDGLDDRQPMQE